MDKWFLNPKLVLAWTVPLAFVGIVVGKSVRPEGGLDAVVAGGLVAILGAIVAGIFNQPNSISKDEDEEKTP